MEPIAVLQVSQSRRIFGTLAPFGIGVLMIYLAAKTPPDSIIALVFLIGFGAFMIWQSYRLYQTSGRHLLLTRETFEDSSGAVICRLDQVKSVEKGVFSFKPANGFAVILKESQKFAWCPGLWWRIGKRIGVGGTTSGRSSRDMADMITVMLTDDGPKMLAEIDKLIAEREEEKDPS